MIHSKVYLHLVQQCRRPPFKLCGRLFQSLDPSVIIVHRISFTFFSSKSHYHFSTKNKFYSTEKNSATSRSSVYQDEHGENLFHNVEFLSIETERQLQGNMNSKSSEMFSLINQWNSLSEKIKTAPAKRRLSKHFDNRHLNSKVQEKSMQIKLTCAEKMDEILKHLIDTHRLSDKTFNLNPTLFQQVMIAWKDSGSPKAGFRCADILEHWGQFYGGDLELAPSVKEFNIVLEAHAKAASGDYSAFDEDEANHSLRNTPKTSLFPAEVAYDIYVFLSNMRDIALLPNISTCSHTIHALTNHAFVKKYANKNLQTTMTTEVAAIRAYSIWKKMIGIISRADRSQSAYWIWRSHSDIIALSSQGMILRNNHEDVQHLGRDTQDLLGRVLQCYDLPYDDSELMEYVQDMYYCTMNGWLIEQEILLNRSNAQDGDADVLNSSIENAASCIHSLIKSMKEKNIKLLGMHYDVLIQAYSNLLKLNDCNLGILVEIFEDIEDKYMDLDFDHESQIQAESFKTAIDATLPIDIEKAEDLFILMVDMYCGNMLSVKKSNRDFHILGYTLNGIVLEHLKKNAIDIHTLNRVKCLVDRLQSATKHWKNQPYSNSVAYGSYLKLALKSDSSEEDSVKILLTVLDEMKRQNLNPTMSTYITAIKVLGSEGNQERLDQAKSLLSTAMKNFSNLSNDAKKSYDFNAAALYSTFIMARNNSRAKPQEAIHLLRMLQRSYEYDMDERLKPDVFLYANVLSSFAWQKNNADSNKWARESLELLNEMESLYRDNNDDTVKPNKIVYTHVLSALSKSSLSDISSHVRDITKRITDTCAECGTDDLKPDFKFYEAALNALGRCDNLDINLMEDLVTSVEQIAKLKPNVFPIGKFYQRLLRSIASMRDTDTDIGSKAEQVLRRMYTLYEHGHWDVKPTADDFHKVLEAWSSSKHPDKALKALTISKEMEERYNKGDIAIKPSCKTFTLVLNSCFPVHRKDFKREDVVLIAVQVKNHFLKHQDIYGPADSLFFVVLIKIFGFCIKDEIQRRRFLATVFESCCKEGLVNDQVLESLKRFDLQLWNSLDHMVLPTEWSSRCTKGRKDSQHRPSLAKDIMDDDIQNR